MTRFTIDVTNDNAFNEGWVAYLLGLPRPEELTRVNDHDEDVPNYAQDGWDMASDTPTIRIVRNVFDQQRQSTYVTAQEQPKEPKAKVLTKEDGARE